MVEKEQQLIFEKTTSNIFNFSKKNINKDALKVIKTLKNHGYKAYVVGGAVRDLILNYQPKDFDIVTDATPREIKNIFKRSQIIGKRFPIVHVYMGKQVLEVSTFRGHHCKVNAKGRIVKDNRFGSIYEDAFRRDFTCNALYLNPCTEEIYSYHQALHHLKNRQLIMIGNINERLKEDPVRILRAVRIATKRQMNIDESLITGMRENACLLMNEPKSRLFDEWVKIIYSKYSYQCVQFLIIQNIFAYIHPITQMISKYVNQKDKILVENTLKQTDDRLKNKQTVSLGFVLAAILWPVLNRAWQINQQLGLKPAHALNNAIISVLDKFQPFWSIPRKSLADINEIWRLQYKLDTIKSQQQIQKLIKHNRFKASYDFLLLRAKSGHTHSSSANLWTNIIESQPLTISISQKKQNF